MAKIYADYYGLLHFSGTDNHVADKKKVLGGMQSPTPIIDEADFVRRVLSGEITVAPIYTKTKQKDNEKE